MKESKPSTRKSADSSSHKQAVQQEVQELFQIIKRIDSVYVLVLKRWNLTMNSYLALESLRENPDGVEPAQLAQTLGILRQSVTAILNDFDRQELIDRKERPTDHRRKIVQLNEKGQLFAEQVHAVVSELDCRGMLAFTPIERRQMIAFHQRFYDAVRDAAREDESNRIRQ